MLGLGTIESPYLISTPQDLSDIRNDLSAYYELVNDIDMSAWGNWETITPDSTLYFSGTVDGKGYKILNFTNNNPTAPIYTGLIGWTYGATFKNISFVNAKVTVNRLSSIFVGRPYLSTFENCHVNGTVTGTSENGGLIGASNRSTFINCHADVTISGKTSGAFSYQDLGTSVFTNCYSNSNVKFIEKINTNTPTTTTKFYGDYYNNSKVTGVNYSGLIGLTDTQMKMESSYTGWDFTDTWVMDGYPMLKVFAEYVAPPVIETKTVNSFMNPIYSSVRKISKSTILIQSYVDAIQSDSKRSTEAIRQIESKVSQINSSVSTSMSAFRSMTQNVISSTSPIHSSVYRESETVRRLLATMHSFEGRVSVYVPISKEGANAYVSYVQTPSMASFSENVTEFKVIQNPSEFLVVENPSQKQVIKNPSYVEVI